MTLHCLLSEMSIETVMVKLLLEVEPPLHLNLFNRNVQNKHIYSECNSVIDLFNLKTNNSGRYNNSFAY